MSKEKEHLLDWLRDAHAMEGQAIQMLKGEEGRVENYPELRQKLTLNEEIARSNQDDLASCIRRLGGDTSSIKDIGGKIMGTGQALSGVMFRDEVMKCALGVYTVQNLAIASYKILVAAADTCGDDETKAVCERILKREEEIAQWLDAYLPELTASFLTRSEGKAAGAKR